MTKEQTTIESTNNSCAAKILEHQNVSSKAPHTILENQLEEKESWDFTGKAWKKWWKAIEQSSNPVSQRLLETSSVKKADTVLDLATGYGEPAITAAIKVGSNGSVTGIDLSSEMLSIAEQRAELLGLNNVEFKQGDIESIELQKEHYDCALSRWGLMFIPNLDKLLDRIIASLKPHGRLAAAVWGPPKRVPLLSLPFEAANKFNHIESKANFDTNTFKCGNIGPFSLSDTNRLTNAFERAGFVKIRLERMELSFELPSAEDFAKASIELSPLLRTILAQFSDVNTMKDKLVEAIAETTRKYVENNSNNNNYWKGRGQIILANEVILILGQRDG